MERYVHPQSIQARRNVTVCVATINRGSIIAACDRMVTSGDVEFEPHVLWKATSITESICAMWAGQAALQAEVIQSLRLRLRDEGDPDEATVRRTVEMYVEEWRSAKRRRAETAVLGSLGISGAQLMNGDHGLSDDLAFRLIASLAGYQLLLRPSNR